MEPKVVVVTGASAGIGAEAARRLGAQGHRLALCGRREDALRQVAAASGDALAVVADVTVRADVERLRDAALHRFGRVDVWIANAGVGIVRPVLELTDDDVDRMMASNLKSVLYGAQAIVPHFRERGTGHLIHVSSVLGRAPVASVRSAYAAAKAAMDSLTRTLRQDLAQTDPGVHVSLLVPGMVATDFGRTAALTSGATGGPPTFTPPPGVAPQPVEVVVDALVDLIAHPRPEAYTNPASAGMVRGYLEGLGALG